MNKEGIPNKPPIDRIRDRVTDETKERVRLMIENSERLHEKMEDKMMTEPHLAYALIQAGFGHAFVQNFLDHGVQCFYDEGSDSSKISEIESIIESFDYEKDKEKTLV